MTSGNASRVEAQAIEERIPLQILIADDQVDVLEALRLLLKFSGHKTVLADSPEALFAAATSRPFDLILMDLNYARDTTSGQEGLDVLDRLQVSGNQIPIIVMTAWGSVDLAVEAMRRGASDFLQKPWDNARLLSTVEKQTKAAAERAQAGRRARSELDIARHVQQKLFPREPAAMETLACAGHCLPASAVGGDYYDFLPLGAHRLGIVLGDVSGKGIGAALLMANLQALFRSQSPEAFSRPAAMLQTVNRLFHQSTPAELYATLFFAVYDEKDRKLTYVNCGHLPPILRRANGEIERLNPTATVLGLFACWQCSEGSVFLRPGDTLLAFSDGVTEASWDGEEEFGEDRLVSVLQRNAGLDIRTLATVISETALSFGSGRQQDDITTVGLRAL